MWIRMKRDAEKRDLLSSSSEDEGSKEKAKVTNWEENTIRMRKTCWRELMKG